MSEDGSQRVGYVVQGHWQDNWAYAREGWKQWRCIDLSRVTKRREGKGCSVIFNWNNCA